MARFAPKQKPPDAGTPSRAGRPATPSAARGARPSVAHPLLADKNQRGLTLTPLAEFLLSEEHPLSREAPHLPYSLPGLRAARPSPTVRREKPRVNNPVIEDEERTVRDEEEADEEMSGNTIIQRQPVPGTPPDRPETPTKLARPTSKAAAPSKISTLRAQSAEIQYKLAQLNELKDWRTAIHAANKERLSVIEGMLKELDQIEKELQENGEGWYLFEYEPAKWTWEKWTRLMKKLYSAYWDVKNAADAEEKYERESQKTEADLRRQQGSIDSEIQTIEKAGTVISQGQYDSLASRIMQLGDAIDKLGDAEIRAAVKYTGSGPGSRAQ